MKRFIRFPLGLYKDCPQYVPALDGDQMHSLTKAAPRSYCELKLWLAEDASGKVAGRIAGMINPRYNELYGRKRARSGTRVPPCARPISLARRSSASRS